jgi:hypothetical protein
MAAQTKGRKRRHEIVTLKVDPELVEAMKHVPNRSAFIRSAILNALDSACPLCQGTGVLTPKQKEHWDAFTEDHSLQECRQCNELHLVCASGARRRVGPHRAARGRGDAAKGGR